MLKRISERTELDTHTRKRTHTRAPQFLKAATHKHDLNTFSQMFWMLTDSTLVADDAPRGGCGARSTAPPLRETYTLASSTCGCHRPVTVAQGQYTRTHRLRRRAAADGNDVRSTNGGLLQASAALAPLGSDRKS